MVADGSKRWRRLVIGTIALLLLVFCVWNAGTRPPATRQANRESGTRVAPSAGPSRPVHAPGGMDAFVSRVSHVNVMTAARANHVERILRELARRRQAGVRAIGRVLRRGDDVDFASMVGGERLGHRTLRQALIDTLGRIGGPDAAAVALEEIRRTTQPMEIVMLARILEREQPGAHREEMIHAASEALRAAEHGPPPDVGPLFDLLASDGTGPALAELERSAPRWEAYALIALADVPDGAGIPSVAALARGADSQLAFRVLAQTGGQYGDAGDALLDLARAGRIPDGTWPAIGEALAGKQLRLSTRMFDGTPLAADASAPVRKTFYVQWLNVRYEEDVVSAGWSDERVDRQLALIEDLRAAASSPAAEDALQYARRALDIRLAAVH